MKSLHVEGWNRNKEGDKGLLEGKKESEPQFQSRLLSSTSRILIENNLNSQSV